MFIKEYFTVIYDWLMILQLLSVSFSVVFVISPAKKDLKGWIRIAIETLLLFIVETAVNVLFFCLSYYINAMRGINFPLSVFVTIFAYVAVYLRENPKSKLILGATILITAVDVTTLGMEAGRYFTAINNGGDYAWISLLSYASIIGFAIVVKLYSTDVFFDIPKTAVLFDVIVVIIAGTYIMISIVAEVPYILSFESGAVMLKGVLCHSYLLIFIAAVLIYFSIYVQCKEYSEKVTIEVENSLLKANADMMVVSNQAMEEVREIRHDIGNQYAVMKIMLKEKRYDDLEKYFASMNIEFEDVVRFVDCGNDLINSVINMEILKAQSSDARIVSIINVTKDMPIDAHDLSRLLVNLIDNAIEALQRETVENRIIEVNISLKNDYLYICVRNGLGKSSDDADLINLNTVKEDNKKHGYGHRIVRKIVNKYNGEINYSVEAGEFIVEAMLDLKSSKENLS